MLSTDRNKNGFPFLGCKCQSVVLKSCFSNILLSIYEIEGVPSRIKYKGLMKYDDTIKTGDKLECIVVSYSDNGINCIRDIN
jgi:hypothetical protein